MTERNLWFDLETKSPVPIKNGTHAYAEKAEITLFAYAIHEGEPRVWDKANDTFNYIDDLSGVWVEEALDPGEMPEELAAEIDNPEVLVWGHNAGMFDFVVIDAREPHLGERIAMERRRDTMVQAFAHSLPGALDKLGEILQLHDDDRKLKDEGRKYIRLFCVPKDDGTFNDKASHPVEWAGFIRYAARDITTMRAAHWKMPKWNYRGHQIELWHEDLLINSRGVFTDRELAEKAVEASDKAKAQLARRVRALTDEEVQAATQRDALLAFILGTHGVELPDMRADTLERRMEDPDLPPEVKELLGIRLRASMNSSAKYKTLLRAVSADGRLRGGAQFRGAGRTGRWAHRLFQWGNLPRPAYEYEFIEAGIMATKAGALDLVCENEMEMCASMVRGVVVAPPGRKLVVADLANGEGRFAAWLAGEEWKLQAFRDFDTILGEDENGKELRAGPDLYVKAYMSSFNITDASVVTKAFRQIGKVQELMFQFGGGVGAWITGAATYGIDLAAMTEAVYDTLPADVVAEATSFLQWLYKQAHEKHARRMKAAKNALDAGEITAAEYEEKDAQLAGKLLKARFNLDEKVFVTCDSLKRLWRAAHPAISSYWGELEDTIRAAINTPGVTLHARKIKIRRDGNWLRLGLPSGRALCYPSIHITKSGDIAYTGQNSYNRQWEVVTTYGGKIFENLVQAVQCDQFAEPMRAIREAGFDLCAGIHDEWIAEVDDDDTHTAAMLADLMVAPNDWNAGAPLAAAGEEMYRYRK